MKKIASPLTIKELSDTGQFAGYGSVFGNRDSAGDIVLPGAFERSLAAHRAKGTNPALLLHHDAKRPCGTYSTLMEDGRGLYVEGRLLLDTTDGKDAFSLLKNGAMSGLSIGYQVVDSEYDAKAGAMMLKDLDLWEVSLVTFPANDEARVTAVKTARDFERFLCDNGFSRNQAKAIACQGFRERSSSNDDYYEGLIIKALERNIQILSTR
ncbi:MAG: HK97 family phage prohead protease [Desulfobulbaceae bacterium]|nr:HK97 family phage prohead protease [Desulfobulbaceae bacterium]